MKKNDGFTLIELMVVLIIIAIIAAIAIPSYQAYARRALAAQMQQEMQRISVLLERHKARNLVIRASIYPPKVLLHLELIALI